LLVVPVSFDTPVSSLVSGGAAESPGEPVSEPLLSPGVEESPA
jgi:hypothetical protein